MKLFASTRSPFARKVLVSASELGGVELPVIPVAPVPGRPHPELAQANPLAKVPTLVLDDGQVLFDSHVICEWLDLTYGPGRLIPSDPASRNLALRREALANGTLDLMLALRAEVRRRSGDMVSVEEALVQMRLAMALDGVERELALQSVHPADIGEISLACALSYADFRFSHLDWRKGRPVAAAWFEVFERRASMQLTAFSDT